METIDFIGAGTARAGSSWISVCLSEHHEILFSDKKSVKEVYFFNQPRQRKYLPELLSSYHRGIEWYVKQFPQPEPGKIRGEFTPLYLQDKVAYKRIKKFFPNVKIIIVLRNPVDRLYSCYWYARTGAMVKVDKSFDKVSQDESFLVEGLFHRHLKKFFDNFPNENIHLVLFDGIKSNPNRVVKSLYRFLEVNDNFVPTVIDSRVNMFRVSRSLKLKNFGYLISNSMKKMGFKRIHDFIFYNHFLSKIYVKVNKIPSKKPPMKSKTRKKLQDYFHDDILKTQALIGRDLSHWLK
jgi:hypothetical protein